MKRSFKKDINRDVTQEDQRQANEKRNQQYKGSKQRRKGARDKGIKGGPESGKTGYYSYHDNDFSWYNTKPELIASAGQIAFGNWAGDPILIDATKKFSYPGIMGVKIAPSIGSEILKTDPVNIAAEKLWSYVFHTVSGQAFADAPDMMIYLLGMSEVYSYIVWLQRLYGLINLWSDENTYMPEGFAFAEDLSLAAVRRDQLRLYGVINALIDQAAALCVPKQFTLFQRRAFMFQNVYTEGITPKSQMYMFVPECFLKFQLNATNQSGELVPTRWTRVSTNVADSLYNFGQEMINSLLSSQDTKKLSTLVRRAFGDEGIIKLNAFPMDYKAPIVYSLEVLEQIKNAIVLPLECIKFNTLGVYQQPEKDTLIHSVIMEKGTIPAAQKAETYDGWALWMQEHPILLTTGVSVPTVPVVVENTRLMPVINFGYTTSGTWATEATIIGASELCTGLRICYGGSDGAKTSITYHYINVMSGISGTTSPDMTKMMTLHADRKSVV